MRSLLIGLGVVGISALFAADDAIAQQRQPRPVTITYRSTTITRTQWSPDSPNPNTTSPGGMSSTTTPDSSFAVWQGNGEPGSQSSAAKTPNPYSPSFSRSTATAGEPFSGTVHRSTNQQLQNPSGGFQLSHVGFSEPASIAPNNYFGAEFHSWSNLQTRSGNLDSFESFNRYQPATDSGGYYSPNTYTGSANNEWSNLSSGSLSPNELGGWTFRP